MVDEIAFKLKLPNSEQWIYIYMSGRVEGLPEVVVVNRLPMILSRARQVDIEPHEV